MRITKCSSSAWTNGEREEISSERERELINNARESEFSPKFRWVGERILRIFLMTIGRRGVEWWEKICL